MAKAHELLALLHERWLLVEGQRQNDPRRLQMACQALGTQFQAFSKAATRSSVKRTISPHTDRAWHA
jgi:hypothetical protein